MRFQYPQFGVLRNVADVPRPRAFPTKRVRVIKRFHALRRELEVGEVIDLPAPDADDAIALSRAVLL